MRKENKLFNRGTVLAFLLSALITYFLIKNYSLEKSPKDLSIVSQLPANQILKNNSIVSKNVPKPIDNTPKMKFVQNGSISPTFSKSIYSEKPKELIAEFELINGYAVAYGDTLIGKPIDGQNVPARGGHVELSGTEFWNKGVVPYAIQENVPNPKRIEQALEFFNQHTAVKFVPYQGQADAIVFERGTENCYSYLGKKGGLQSVVLSDKCGSSEIMHELMHALGFVHEQSRTDRDRYLEILWDNIEEKYKSQFSMIPEPLMDAYRGSGFDEHSIMMYDPKAFVLKPDLVTMRSLTTEPLSQPPAVLSAQDIHRVNRLYGFE